MISSSSLFPVIAYPYIVSTPRAAMAVSLATVKTHLRLDASDTSEDSVLTTFIEAATDYIESVTGRTLINTSYTTYRNEIPSEIELRRSPYSSVTSLHYLNISKVWTSLSSSLWQVIASKEYNVLRLWPDSFSSLPSDYIGDVPQSFRAIFVAGYGSGASSLPSGLTQALLQIIGALYANRGDCTDGSSSGCDCEALAPGSAKALLSKYKIKNLTTIPTIGYARRY